MATSPERILQSATNSSFWMVYKNPEVETQEQETVEPLEQALAIIEKGPLQDPVSADVAAHSFLPHKNSALLREKW